MRMRYVDDMNQEGEMDIGQVRVGDLVRFIADFRKVAGPKGVIFVPKDEIGEVLEVRGESVRVAAPGHREAAGDQFTEDFEIEVQAGLLKVVVDARDPRISTNRIMAWDLEALVREVAAARVPLRVDYVAAELFRRARWRQAQLGGRAGDSATEAARLLLKTSEGAWQSFLLASGFDVQAAVDAANADIVEAADWALGAMGAQFQAMNGRPLAKTSRGDVAWALEGLASDLELSLPKEVYEGGSDLENAKSVAQKLRGQASRLRAMSDEDWAGLTGQMEGLKTPMAPPMTFKPPQTPAAPAAAPAPAAPVAPPAEVEPATMEPGTVPIHWRSPGGDRWVWGQPGMEVFLRSHSARGTIQSIAGDQVTVATPEGPLTSDATDVWLYQRGDVGAQQVPYDELAAWKSQRRRHGSRYELGDGEDAHADRIGGAGAAGGGPGHSGGDSNLGPRVGQVMVSGQLRHGVVFLLPGGDGDGTDRSAGAETFGDRSALAPLGIKEMKRWLDGPGEFAVLSAYQVRPKSQNQQAHGTLMGELQRRGYTPSQIRPLKGQYFDKPQGAEAPGMKAEQSYLVLGMTFEDAIELGAMFGQESVIYKSPDGVVGSYFTDGSGRVNLALAGDDVAIGSASTRIEERAPKPEKRGPPAASDPWSKGRNVGFEFPIDWAKTFGHGGRPLNRDEARQQLEHFRLSQPPKPEPTPDAAAMSQDGSIEMSLGANSEEIEALWEETKGPADHGQTRPEETTGEAARASGY